MSQLILKSKWEKDLFPKLSEKKELEKLRNNPNQLIKKLVNNSLAKVELNIK